MGFKGGFTQELIRELELERRGVRAKRRRPLRPPRACRRCGSELKAELRTRTLPGRRALAYVLCPNCGSEARVGVVSF